MNNGKIRFASKIKDKERRTFAGFPSRKMGRSTARNAAMMGIQVVISGGSLFALYRIMLIHLGTSTVGLWGVLLATMAFFRLADFGMSGSVVKLVAQYRARGEVAHAADRLEDAVVTVGLAGGALLLAGYPAAIYLSPRLFPHAQLSPSLFPVLFCTAWLSLVGTVIYAGLDGMQRYDLRGSVLCLGSVAQVLATFVLIRPYGLLGVAVAQLLQWALILVLALVLLKHEMPVLLRAPHRLRTTNLRELFGYGLSFQAVSIAALFSDPVTKMLLNYFGGLETVAYFDMSNRLILQVRQVLVSVSQVLVAIVSDLHESAPEKVRSVYLTAFTVLGITSIIFYSGLALTVPVISQVWIGHYEREFALFSLVLIAGAFINTLGAPAFFTNFGAGLLGDNIICQCIAGGSNAVLGVVLGALFGGFGVVLGSSASIALAGIALVVQFARKRSIGVRELVPWPSIRLTSVVVAAVAFAYGLESTYVARLGHVGGWLAGLGQFIVLVAPFLWLHPLRKWAWERVQR